MNHKEESLEMRRHRLRQEMRRLEQQRFIASLIFGLTGFAGITAILYWAVNYTTILTDMIEKGTP